jgi:hypothetical protein
MMDFVNGKDDIPNMTWKIKVMFQTTSQLFGMMVLEHIFSGFL